MTSTKSSLTASGSVLRPLQCREVRLLQDKVENALRLRGRRVLQGRELRLLRALPQALQLPDQVPICRPSPLRPGDQRGKELACAAHQEHRLCLPWKAPSEKTLRGS